MDIKSEFTKYLKPRCRLCINRTMYQYGSTPRESESYCKIIKVGVSDERGYCDKFYPNDLGISELSKYKSKLNVNYKEY